MSAVNPESGTTSYGYDNDGNLLTRKRNSPTITTTMTYDALNRALTKTYSDGTPAVTYHYDNKTDGTAITNGIGHLTSISSSVSTETYDSFDALGRVLGSTQTTPTTGGTSYTFGYTYNLAGEMLTETYPSGKVINISYDGAGRTSQVKRTGGPAYASSIAYTAPGARQSMTLGNGLIDQTTYNSRLEPTKVQLGASSSGVAASSVLELDYRFNSVTQSGTAVADNNGNVLEETVKIGSTAIADQSYSYDPLNRIQTASETSGGASSWSRTFNYDVYGNMWVPVASASGILPGSQTPTAQTNFNSNNQLVLGSSAYDGAGNLKTDPDGNHITYDAENRMATFSAVSGNMAATYSYDGNGERISKQVTNLSGTTTTTYVYNAMGQLIAEYGGPTPAPTPGTSYLTTDHLGSTRVITDSSTTPNVLERDDYLPFGEEIGNVGAGRSGAGVVGYSSSTDIHQKFTSKERDSESNLDFFEARYFSSAQGRFTSPDEFSGGPENLFDFAQAAADNPTFYALITNPQSLNKYQYCYNNPLSFIDPNGHQTTADRYLWQPWWYPVPSLSDRQVWAQKLDDARATLGRGLSQMWNKIKSAYRAGGGDGTCYRCDVTGDDVPGSQLNAKTTPDADAQQGAEQTAQQPQGQQEQGQQPAESPSPAGETAGMGGRTLSSSEQAEFDAFGKRAQAQGLVENPNRTGSWGRIENGKFEEVARIDVGEAGKPGWRGHTHTHIEGVRGHLDPATKLPGEQ